MCIKLLDFGGTSEAPVVFLHGFMGAGRNWEAVANGLSAERRVLAVDLPGHGAARCNEPAEFAMSRVALRLVTRLAEQEIRQFDLVGYSMGGRLALFIALHFPQNVRRLVLESSSPGIERSSERDARRNWDRSVAKRLESESFELFLREWYAMPLFDSFRKHADFETVVQERLKNDPAQLAISMREMGTGSQPSLWSAWERCAVPTLLIAGELDAKYVGISAEMQTRNPTAQRIILTGTGHNTHFEQPRKFQSLLHNFLRSNAY